MEEEEMGGMGLVEEEEVEVMCGVGSCGAEE